MLLLLVAACTDYSVTKIEDAPLELTLTSPSYGAFLGSDPITVTGVVTPADAALTVNGAEVHPDADGTFSTTLDWTDRAMLVNARATRAGEIARAYVPVFDGVDPRAYDPGALRGLFTQAGLDGLEPTVASMVDSLGWEDQILAVLPSVDTDYLDITPSSVTSDGTDVALTAEDGAVGTGIALQNVAMTATITVVDSYSFDVTLSFGTIGITADASPTLVDDNLQLNLSNLVVDIGDVGMDFGGLEVPDWLTSLLLDPIASLVADLGTYLGSYLLDQYGAVDLGGPFATSFDLMGTQLSTRLAEVDTTTDGVGLGVTVGYDEDAADSLPDDLVDLGPTTPDGKEYQLGLSVHEGMLNVVMDEVLSDYLDIDMTLEGDVGELMATGFTMLPGGDQLPEDRDGFCLSIHSGDARVVRMVEGTGTPLARAYLPDLRVQLQVDQGGECEPWLDAVLLTTVDLTLDGTAVSASIGVPQAVLLDYGATGVDDQEVADQLGSVVTGMASLLAGNLSFDLGDTLSLGGIAVDPQIVAIEPLDETGLYGVYTDVF